MFYVNFHVGQIQWLYQDSPDDNTTNPYVAARGQESVTLHLKSESLSIVLFIRISNRLNLDFGNNATDSIAYNYFVPSQHLKNFICFVSYLLTNRIEPIYVYLQLKMSTFFVVDWAESIRWCLWCTLSPEEIII